MSVPIVLGVYQFQLKTNAIVVTENALDCIKDFFFSKKYKIYLQNSKIDFFYHVLMPIWVYKGYKDVH